LVYFLNVYICENGSRHEFHSNDLRLKILMFAVGTARHWGNKAGLIIRGY